MNRSQLIISKRFLACAAAIAPWLLGGVVLGQAEAPPVTPHIFQGLQPEVIRPQPGIQNTGAGSVNINAQMAAGRVNMGSAVSVTVQVDKPAGQINPWQNGIFFEDINFAGDGGLYPQRIKNGSFEFEDPMMGWRRPALVSGGAVGGFGVVSDKPLNANNPHFLRVFIEQPGDGLPLSNEGFRAGPNNENNRGNPGGIGVTQGAKFTFSLYARSNATQPMSVTAEVLGANGRPVAAPVTLSGFGGDWKKYSATVDATATDPKCRLTMTVKGVGTLDLDMVSLFPEETFMNRPNGLRADLGQLLKDMHPGFMRFPGGCIVEGRDLSQRYQWKTTISDVSERKLIMNRWNVEFASPRNAPDYYESMGLGFFEYFQLCEDIGAKPLPILNCGMACQFNLAELLPLNQLDPFVQDALDLIEFANGPASSTWGAKRAAMGHPAPFNMEMIGIGNEQWGVQYFERYERFAKAIKAKYPQMILVSGTGPEPADGPNDTRFSFAWDQLRKLNADLVDEHFYKSPSWFYSQLNRYDNYDRKGPKVFAGEYAAHIAPKKDGYNSNTWEAALAEAAMLTSFERNGDVVSIASYAPLFAHVDAWQWNPNLIWFDNLRSLGTVNYYVQKMFMMNKGNRILPISVQGNEKVYGSALRDESTGMTILKIVNSQPNAQTIKFNLSGANGIQKSGEVQTMASSDLALVNTLDEPKKLVPTTGTIDNLGAEFSREVPGYSVTVIKIPMSK